MNMHPSAKTDQTDQPSIETTPLPPAPPQRHWQRKLKWTLCSVLALVSILIGFSGWLMTTTSGLRFGVLTLPKWFGIQTHVDQLSGSLWHGFAGKNWHIRNSKFQLDISQLSLRWRHHELWHRQLHINLLDIGQIHFINMDTAPKPASAPATLPKSIKLPLRIKIDRLVLAGFSIGKNQQVILLPTEASYSYDHQQHQLNLKQLATPWHTASGTLTLKTAFPFLLQGQFNGHGQLLDDTEAKSQILASGNLQQLVIKAQLQGKAVALKLHTELKPFAKQLNQKIVFLELNSEHLNPLAFSSALPLADINIQAQLTAVKNQPDVLNGHIQLHNAQARAYNSDTHTSIPVRSILGQFEINQLGQVIIPNLSAQLLKQGQINLSGQINSEKQQLDLNTRLSHISAGDVMSNPLTGELNGYIRLHGPFNALQTSWQLNSEQINSQGSIHIQTDTQKHQQTLLLDQLLLKPLNGGEIRAHGQLALYQQQALQLQLSTHQLNPAKLNPQLPSGKINSQLNLSGHLANTTDLLTRVVWQDSLLSGAPLSGHATLQFQKNHLRQANINLSLGNNRIMTNGSFGQANDKLNLDINAPNLNLFGLGLQGAFNTKGFITGEPQKLTANLVGNARHIQFNQLFNIDHLDYTLIVSPEITRPVNIDIKGNNIRIGQSKAATVIKQINLNLKGRGNQHQLHALSDLTIADKSYHASIQANGGLDQHYQWRGRINVFDLAGAFNLKLLAPIQLEAGAQKVLLNQAHFSALGGSLNINHLNWIKNQGIISQGQANQLDLRELRNLVTLPVQQNLILGGDWNFAYNNNMQGYLKLYQQSGDIILPLHQQPLGLSQVKLETRFQHGNINNHLKGHTRYGDVEMVLNISQNYGHSLINAPINGNIKINSSDLNNLRNLLPIGMQVKGMLDASANIRGVLSAPLLSGRLNGHDLYYRDQSSGTILENGHLSSHFDGRRWVIDQLNFKRHDGEINLAGVVDLTQLTPDVNVNAHFNHYMLLDKVNSKLAVSGNARLLYTIAHGITLSGQLKVDRSRFGFQKSGMPTLDDDVVVLGRDNPQTEQRPTPIRMDLQVDLNNAFRFNAEGIDVLLGGQLTAKANPGENIQVVGTVNVVKGQYKAYGQDLVIQGGSTVSFVGPLDNPNLKIRAKRRYSQVGAGVEALGSLSNPRINLIADEAMSEKDKLSWLILNRASSGSAGDEAAIAAAAGAWLAGGLNNKLKLFDEIGLTSRQSRNSQTGEMNPAEQAITIGKHISNNLYISYLYGIESATQTISLTYQINRMLQSIVHFGTDSVGGEIRYTHRFD